MLNYLILLVAVLVGLCLFGGLCLAGLGQKKEKEVVVDLKIAHHVINQIGLDSQDDLFTSQIKQLFMKNRKVTPDLIEHLAEHYQIPVCQLYLKIHQIVNQPLKC